MQKKKKKKKKKKRRIILNLSSRLVEVKHLRDKINDKAASEELIERILLMIAIIIDLVVKKAFTSSDLLGSL